MEKQNDGNATVKVKYHTYRLQLFEVQSVSRFLVNIFPTSWDSLTFNPADNVPKNEMKVHNLSPNEACNEISVILFKGIAVPLATVLQTNIFQIPDARDPHYVMGYEMEPPCLNRMKDSR